MTDAPPPTPEGKVSALDDRPDGAAVTLLLRQWQQGDHGAQEEVWPLIYGEMRRLAGGLLRSRGRRAGRGRVGTTTLVHEAYLRLVGNDPAHWNERGHFFAVASRAMRFVLVDDARRRLAKKRAAEDSQADIPRGAIDPAQHPAEDLVAVHQVLGRLARINPRHEQLVEMRYFAGLSIEETADALQVSRPTVVRDWKAVRTWLYAELSTGGLSPEGPAAGQKGRVDA